MTFELPGTSVGENDQKTGTEKKLATVWSESLQQHGSSIQPTDDFFALGGDSLAMTVVLFRVQQEFGAELSPASLLENPTLRQFAAIVDMVQGEFTTVTL